MLKNDTILDAFIGETIVIHLPATEKLPEAFVRETMKDAKIEFEKIEKNQARLF